MFSFSRVFTRRSIQKTLFNSKWPSNSCCTKSTEHKLRTDTLPKVPESYGQPTPETHPHLMKHGELVPGIVLSEFKQRRDRLMEHFFKSPVQKHHLAIIPSATKKYMTEKIPYVFRQNSDFFYLTGCLEPDSVLVMFGDNSDNYRSIIFLRKKDAHFELWDGPRTGVDKGAAFFGVNEALPIGELKSYLTAHLKCHPSLLLWYDDLDSVNECVDKTVVSLMENSKGLNNCESPRIHIHQLRLIKSPAEQRLMQESCNITSAAMIKAMSISKPGMTEHQLFATVDYETRMRGAEILAYPPVVAAGNNGTIIHYINNTQQTQHGDMILMDAGCEYHGYVSDITRTWPVNGKFTNPQRVLYEIILAVQLELIQLTNSRPPLDNLFHFMCHSLGQKLKEACIFSTNVSVNELTKIAYDFCPHHVSHYLGLDVHDTALISRGVPLKEGMVVTVEPGIYITHNNELARPEFRGFGVRIEDDILVAGSGSVILSSSVPKELGEVERVVTAGRSV